MKKELPIINFDTHYNKKWAKENHIFQPKYYENNLPIFIKNQELHEKFLQGRYFINCTVKWMEITRRQKGYFGYKEITKNNCLVQVTGREAIIFGNKNEYNTSKFVDGKYFEIRGKEVTKRTFLKHKEKLQKLNEENDRISREKEILEKQERERKSRLSYLQIAKEKPSFIPTTEQMSFIDKWRENGMLCMDISENNPEVYQMKIKSGLSWSEFKAVVMDFTNKLQLV